MLSNKNFMSFLLNVALHSLKERTRCFKTLRVLCCFFFIVTCYIPLHYGYTLETTEKALLGQVESKDKAVADLAITTEALQQELDTTKVLYEELQRKIKEQSERKVTVTFYHPKSRGINSDSDPSKTATMVEPIAGWHIAVSDKLVEQGWLGKKVYIEGYGVRYASDRMDRSIKGYAIDICVGSKKLAYRLGRKNNVLATKLLE